MNQAQEFFNNHAVGWDRNMVANHDKIAVMITLSDISPHCVILDVGCGTGILEPYLLQYQPSAILAVDFAPNMVQEAKRKLVHPAVRFVCADIMDITDFQADHCFIYNTFPHFPDPQATLNHITALIRSGGRITISHTQGKHLPQGNVPGSAALPPAQLLHNVLAEQYHVDVIVDNNAMFLVSALKR